MANRKFLTSVADVFAYDASDNIVFTAKTLVDSSIEASLGSAPVRGGRGNQLQYIYYHTGELKVTLTDAQWNLQMLGATVGSELYGLQNYYKEETVIVTASSGSVSATPLAFTGSILYGWATSPLGLTQRVIFTGTGFTVTGTETSGNWCVRYYTANLTQGQSFTVNANMIPKVVKLVMETQLNSADVTTNKIGIVQIVMPTVALSGAFSISMKSDGVTTTPLTGMALAYTPAAGADACATQPYYAKITEIIDNTLWYSNVSSLVFDGGNYTQLRGTTETQVVYAIPTTYSPFIVPNSSLTWSSTYGGSLIVIGTGTVFISASHTPASGSIILKAAVSASPAISGTVNITIG